MEKRIKIESEEFVKDYIDKFKKPTCDAFVAGAEFVKKNLHTIIGSVYHNGCEYIEFLRHALNRGDAEKKMQEILIEYKQELLKHENVYLEDFTLEITSDGLTFWDNMTGDDSLRVQIFKPNEQN